MQLSTIYDLFFPFLKPEIPFNLYQSGSRVFGTASNKSDYDFFLVIQNEYFEFLSLFFKTKQPPTTELLKRYQFDEKQLAVLFATIGKQWNFERLEEYECLFFMATIEEPGKQPEHISINFNLYSAAAFEQKLQRHHLQFLMCYFLPGQHVWKGSLDFGKIDIQFRKLSHEVVGAAGKHFEQGRRRWNSTTETSREVGDNPSSTATSEAWVPFFQQVPLLEHEEQAYSSHKNNHELVQGDGMDSKLYECKKFIIHSIRDLLFGIQIANEGKISNFQAANSYYFDIMSEARNLEEKGLWNESWQLILAKYEPIYEDLKRKFTLLVKKEKTLNSEKLHAKALQKEASKSSTLNQAKSLRILQVLNDEADGEDYLQKFFSLRVKRIPVEGGHFVLISGTRDSPLSHQEVLEAYNGLILFTAGSSQGETSTTTSQTPASSRYNLVCLPLPKFLPHTNHFSPVIRDWKHVEYYYEPENSIMIHLFSFRGKWCTATSSRILSESDEVSVQFWSLLRQRAEYVSVENESKSFTFTMFNMGLSSKNMDHLQLIGIQDNTQMTSMPITIPSSSFLSIPQHYQFSSYDQMYASLIYNSNPFIHKGVVVIDKITNQRNLVPSSQNLNLQKLKHLQTIRLWKPEDEHNVESAMLDVIRCMAIPEKELQELLFSFIHEKREEMLTTFKRVYTKYIATCAAVETAMLDCARQVAAEFENLNDTEQVMAELCRQNKQFEIGFRKRLAALQQAKKVNFMKLLPFMSQEGNVAKAFQMNANSLLETFYNQLEH